MRSTLHRWSDRLSNYRIFTNAFALLVSMAGSGLLGLIYWDLAAHRTSESSVGRAAGEIAAVTLLSSFAQLSYGSIFQRYLPRGGSQSRRFTLNGYIVCSSLALVLSLAYSALGFTHRFFEPSLRWTLLFVATTIVYTIFALEDAVLISLRVSRWVAVENNLFGLAKFLLLFPLAALALGQGIVFSWTLPLIATVLVVNWYIFARRLPEQMRTQTSTEALPSFRRMLSLSIPQYVTSILTMVTTSVATLIVIARLGAVANSHYFLVAQVAAAPALFLWSITRLLVVEAGHNPLALRRHVRQAVSAEVAVIVASIAFGVPLAHSILRLFGPAYADQGTTLLRLLLLALPGTAIAALYAAFAWIDGRLWYLMVREGVVMVVFLSIVLTFIGSRGINAVGYASLATAAAEFLVFLPIVVRRIRALPRPDGTVGETLS